MEMTTQRKTALITGAGRNIGRAIALDLARMGFNVVINGSRNRDACEKVAAEARTFGVEALLAMADVGVAEECTRIARDAIPSFGAVDVLAIDNDNWSVENTRENLELNGCSHIRVEAGDADFLADSGETGFQCFLANIHKQILTRDVKVYARSMDKGALLAVSGFSTATSPIWRRPLSSKVCSCTAMPSNKVGAVLCSGRRLAHECRTG